MENESYEARKGTIVYKSRPPLDVRIVAYFLYGVGFLQVVFSVLLGAQVGKPVGIETRRVLLGTVVLSSALADAIYMLCLGTCHLFCAWGLMRRAGFSWWFALAFFIYYLIDEAFLFPKHHAVVLIGGAMGIALIAWLWFRRERYGVHLAASQTKK
jgi:predicted anti-sigma-YlaC factor YlaD